MGRLALVFNIIATLFVLLSWGLHFRSSRAVKLRPTIQLYRSNGMIYHPVHGTYPEKVEYKPGITLYPGQKFKGTVCQ